MIIKKVYLKDKGVARFGFAFVLVFDADELLGGFPANNFVFTESKTSLFILIGVIAGVIIFSA
jgi:hypothetical protein